eukprot:CAMPEP_0184326118 /NCGR_PEP_ID=MMETSP1049-20130417/142391_1 /TAXON_ID=77928 /ORGANISM="Proteomonas sulcata, Strain CCMP704" /LENGTH=108 /DNA_ID=CAMNT_0026648289 /DNA_START=1089 /DNA_END=1415 /DNA_ORIENTATION=+
MAFDASASKSVVEESTEMSNLNPMFMCKAFYRQREILSKKTREAVKCPALVIHGKKDLVVPLEGDEGARALADFLQAPLEVVEQASHQVMMEQPQQVAEAIDRFAARP